MLHVAGCNQREVEELNQAAKFTNGKPNVARLERMAKTRVADAVGQGRLVWDPSGRGLVRRQ